MKLLIGSVFKDTSSNQIKWLKLQLKFINETTTDFQHIAYVNHIDTEAFNPFTKVISLNDIENKTTLPSSKEHVRGLIGLVKYFKEVRNNYDSFLLIDNFIYLWKQV